MQRFRRRYNWDPPASNSALNSQLALQKNASHTSLVEDFDHEVGLSDTFVFNAQSRKNTRNVRIFRNGELSGSDQDEGLPLSTQLVLDPKTTDMQCDGESEHVSLHMYVSAASADGDNDYEIPNTEHDSGDEVRSDEVYNRESPDTQSQTEEESTVEEETMYSSMASTPLRNRSISTGNADSNHLSRNSTAAVNIAHSPDENSILQKVSGVGRSTSRKTTYQDSRVNDNSN